MLKATPSPSCSDSATPAPGIYDAVGLLNQWNHHPGIKEPMMLEAPAYPPRIVSAYTDERASREIYKLLEARFGHPKRDELLSVLGRGLEDFAPNENPRA